MKKILYYASALLAVFMTYSCSSIEDNPVPADYPVTIEDEDGNKHEAYLVASFSGEVGSEVSLTLGVYDTEDTYFVDFGDGKMQTQKVGLNNKGPVREDGTTPSATVFKGTVAGDGLISIYGNNDLWYLVASGNAIPTSFDQKRLKKVVQMSFTGANVDKVELPQLDSLTQFSFNNSPVQSVDVSKCVKLTSLTINNTSASKYEPQLESIDLSNNPDLGYLSLQGNNKVSGKLKTLDLSNNTKLSGMGLYVQYNQLEELILSENALTLINVQNNKLKSIDLAKLPKLKSLYAANNLLEGELDLTAYATMENVQLDGNKLTAVKFNNITKTFWIENNNFTLATIPAQPAGLNTKNKTKQFHYAPQAALEVPETVSELDLSSQLTVEKGELNPTGYAEYLSGTTTYSFVTASGTALVEGTDYEVTAPGKFKFIKAQSEKVHGVMLNTALPKFTAAAPYTTTEFTVNASEQTAEARTWDFTKWSAETVANLKADAAKVTVEDDPDNPGYTKCTNNGASWSDHEKVKKCDSYNASKDNCFWLSAETTDANGKAIAELAGLQFDTDYCTSRSLAIAVNYPSTSLGTYAGASYLWLGGKNKTCFTIPGVKAGQKITMVVESHKASEGRGVTINDESFAPKEKDSHTWTIATDGDVVVKNTNGCHIYSIEVK